MTCSIKDYSLILTQYSPDSRIKNVESPKMPTVPGPAELLRTLLNMIAPDATPNPRPPTTVKQPIA